MRFSQLSKLILQYKLAGKLLLLASNCAYIFTPKKAFVNEVNKMIKATIMILNQVYRGNIMQAQDLGIVL